MKINTKQLTAALFATVILSSSAFAGSQWPSRPDYSAPEKTTVKQTTAKVTTTRGKHTIATYVAQPAPKADEVEIPRFHNIGNGSF